MIAVHRWGRWGWKVTQVLRRLRAAAATAWDRSLTANQDIADAESTKARLDRQKHGSPGRFG